MKFGLRGIRKLLRSLGNPETQFPSIHVAGTNGKGSTASMIAAIFIAAGYKTGLYTSPHLVDFSERIRINGKPISQEAVARLTNRLRQEIEKNNSTFFEATTAMAFRHFSDSRVDIAVVETGMGGRYDATNALKPLVSVITSIGLEHRQLLGNTVREIAFEKAGIIKRGVPCVTAVSSLIALKVIKDACAKKQVEVRSVPRNAVHLCSSTIEGFIADFYLEGWQMKRVRVSLAGSFQLRNTALALLTVNQAAARGDFEITEHALRRGLANVQKYSGLQARLSVVQRNPQVIADVAHNPEAMRALCFSLKELGIGKCRVVFGVMQDKDHRAMIRPLENLAQEAIVVSASTERSRPPTDLAEEFRNQRATVVVAGSVKAGVKAAIAGKSRTPILITGSHFVVGEALAFLRKKKYLTINQ